VTVRKPNTRRINVSVLVQTWSPIYFRQTRQVRFHTVQCFACKTTVNRDTASTASCLHHSDVSLCGPPGNFAGTLVNRVSQRQMPNCGRGLVSGTAAPCNWPGQFRPRIAQFSPCRVQRSQRSPVARPINPLPPACVSLFPLFRKLSHDVLRLFRSKHVKQQSQELRKVSRVGVAAAKRVQIRTCAKLFHRNQGMQSLQTRNSFTDGSACISSWMGMQNVLGPN